MSTVEERSNVEISYTDPKTGKFVPNNPGGGRKEGSKNVQTIFREAMQKIAEVDGLSAEDIELELAKVGIEKAKKGDYRYWQDIHDRLHGKAVQRTENKNLNADVHKLKEEEKQRFDDLIKWQRQRS